MACKRSAVRSRLAPPDFTRFDGFRRLSPSSRGLGHHPFTVRTGVRIPVGTPHRRLGGPRPQHDGCDGTSVVEAVRVAQVASLNRAASRGSAVRESEALHACSRATRSARRSDSGPSRNSSASRSVTAPPAWSSAASSSERRMRMDPAATVRRPSRPASARRSWPKRSVRVNSSRDAPRSYRARSRRRRLASSIPPSSFRRRSPSLESPLIRSQRPLPGSGAWDPLPRAARGRPTTSATRRWRPYLRGARSDKC